MELLDGKKLKLKMLKELKEKIKDKASLVVIQIGEDSASDVYIKQKENMAKQLEFGFNHIKLPKDIKQEDVITIIENLNKDNDIDGIIVQMPIPNHLDKKEIQNAILPCKDVDGLTDLNAGALVHEKETMIPCTALGILNMLKNYEIELEGKDVVIVGRSDLVGKPLIHLMLNNNATVTVCHSKTKNLEEKTKQADILIVAIGKANLIKKEHIKDGAIVIDVGINRLGDKIVGDVDFENVKDKCSYITPVPGGVGQMTVMELMNNTYKAKILKENNRRNRSL